MPRRSDRQETVVNRQWASILRLADTGDIEKAVSAILRLPDKLTGREEAVEIDYPYLASYLAGLEASTPLARTVGQLAAGLCLYRAGDVAGSREHFRQAAGDAGGIPDERRARFLQVASQCGEAWALMRSRELAEAARRARSAVARAEPTGSTWLMAHARHALGRVLAADPAQRDRALGLLNEAKSGYVAPDVNDLRGAGYCLQIAGRLEADGGDVERGLADLHDGLSRMRRSRGERGAAAIMLDIGWLRAYQQSFALARGLGRDAINILGTRNDYRGLAKAHNLVGWTHLCEGRTHEAEASFLRARDYCHEVQSPATSVVCSYYLARCAFVTDRDEDCVRYLKECAELEGYDVLIDLAVRGLVAARAIRRRRWKRASDSLHLLTGDLKAAGVHRIEADTLFLCGFEWCRADRLEDAAPLLRRALEVAADAQAAATIQAFLAANESATLDRWMASLVGNLVDRARLQQQLADQLVAAEAGFHDLRNEVTAVYSMLMLAEQLPGEVDLQAVMKKAMDTAKFAEDLRAAFAGGRDLLKPQLEPFDAAAFIKDQAFTNDAVTIAGLTYRTDIESGLPAVMADPRMIARVFGNFRTNAQKYAPNSTISLSAKARRNANGEAVGVILGFADTGPGIHPQDLEIIFTPRKHPSQYRVKRKNHGSGIGLGYCRVVVEGHGGRIWATSKLGEGAAFFVELPVTAKAR